MGPMAVSKSSDTVGPRGTRRALAETYDVGLLDLDGVVYLDGEPITSARPALTEARKRGMRFAFVTNNASRTPGRIAAQLGELGVRATEGDVVSSAQAAARLVADRVAAASSVLVVGGVGLRWAVRDRGLRPVTSARDDPAAVVQGYDPHLSYELLAEGALAVRDGAVFVASNADRTMPTPRGPVPGNGSLVRVIATASRQEPIVAGKPELPLHREAVLRTGAREPLVVGDRLDTDIAGAVRSGTDSLLVLTGVTDPADLIAAPPHLRPTYVARDLGGLVDSHPDATRDGDIWGCRGWSARSAYGRLSLQSDAASFQDPVDALRALCAAAWSDDEPIDRPSLAETLRGIGITTGRRAG